ncbi:MAG: hypothetical protein H6624_00975 [Bdellovibrionaceae bacterium]|nr:hypothetical protein [Bdellovibrionales bacterium]MCB9082881.1 hypothetical protein [Pseudobdellovibrionaceae bacterium]
MAKKPDKCLCAFCRLERRIYRKKHISPTNILLAMITSLAVMIGVWQAVDARVLVVFVFCLAISELFIQIRWRLTLACPFCGFDPVLYVKNPQEAASRVRVKLERAKEGTALLSVHNPWTHLAPLTKKSRRNILSELELAKEKGDSTSLPSAQI